MKEQYVGDVNDYRKFALMRRLAGSKIGICWMLTPPDGRGDGEIAGYLDRPQQWAPYDPELFDLLHEIRKEGGPLRLRHLEKSGIISGATYFNEFISDRESLRRAYFDVGMDDLAKTDLIFFDPDNGIDVPSIAKRAKGSSKYLYRDELALTYQRGHSVLLYQHFVREGRDGFIGRIGTDIASVAPGAILWAFRAPHAVFFLAVHPRHHNTLGPAADAASSNWESSFIVGQQIANPTVSALSLG